LKTPLSYYGGKQRLAARIPGMIPEHRVYCEPYRGGAAIFFAREPSQVEIINDTNGEIINFYEVLKRDFPALEREIEISLHSRKQRRHARVIHDNPDMFDRVKRAWAVWIPANVSYTNKLDGGFGYDRDGTSSKKAVHKRAAFNGDYAIRLRQARIECCDALRIIRSRDTPETFFYLDPPYPGTDQGHYDGYTRVDFEALPGVLESIQGKFLLSSFRNAALVECTRKNAWYTVEFRLACAMTHSGCRNVRAKVEVLTANYPISVSKKGRKG
jgi:DNA adenine methylase